MRYETNRWIVFLLAMLLCLTGWGNVQASDAREEIATLVRALGYGAGIHNFKNFVLRGRDENYDGAKKSFGIALSSLNQLEDSTELTRDDKAAVAALKNMVDEYNRGLDQILSLRSKGWRLGDVDRSVLVDDTVPIASLDQLREKWNWSDLEQVEYLLGYGKGIHNFKNFVLRGEDRYYTLALENFLEVESLLTNLHNNPGMNSTQRGAVDKIKMVVESYRNYLSLVDRFQNEQYPVRKIDLAVKVNDNPAIEGLTLLSQ